MKKTKSTIQPLEVEKIIDVVYLRWDIQQVVETIDGVETVFYEYYELRLCKPLEYVQTNKQALITAYVEKDISDEWEKVRIKRDKLLADTDYYLMPDYPATEVFKQNMKNYRQSLRDIPETFSSPFLVVWPVKPA